MHKPVPLDKLTNWQSRQRDSINFWMGVEAGRNAAFTYRKYQKLGSRRAFEYASDIIEELDNPLHKLAAQKEFDLALSLLANDEDKGSNLIT